VVRYLVVVQLLSCGRNVKRTHSFVIVIVAGAVLASCGVLDPDDGARNDLVEARQRWDGQGIAAYEFVVMRSCYCIPEAIRPYRIRVMDGVIVDVRDAETGAAPLSSLTFRTIHGLFDLVEDAIEQEAYVLEVEYHQQLGYPTHISIDYDRQTADEEQGFTVSAFVAME
jgi:hypothetical protein